MDNDVIKNAARMCHDVYDYYINHGTIQYETKNGILAIAGTNEWLDWLKNFDLRSWKGIKRSAYKSAITIQKELIDPYSINMVCGHSLGGAVAIAYAKLFNVQCVAFAPARCLRYWTNRKMENATIFLNDSDIVSKLGFISFGHPNKNIIKIKDKKGGHSMNFWLKYIEDKIT